jgi:Xaa-Pro aminopeptidase
VTIAVAIGQRLKSLRSRLEALELDLLLITHPPNVRYLSGFTGSLGYLLIGHDVAEIVGDSRYWLQMEEESAGFSLVRATQSGGLTGLLSDRLRASKARRVGFEADHLTIAMLESLKGGLANEAELVSTSGVVEALRARKDSSEVELLRRAADLASLAYNQVLPRIRPGLREKDLSRMLETAFIELGGKAAFETIVGSGPRGALAHAAPTDRVLRKGDLVVIDFGAELDGYHSDITRTLVLGHPDARQQAAVEAVAAAQASAMKMARSGLSTESLDRTTRDAVAEVVGEDGAFMHGLGHGIGLEVHEYPIMGRADGSVLEPGMVVTIEPGAYLAGFGGVRFEEMVLITDQGSELLTTASRQVIVEA